MDILNAIILGIVEGLTEFLPISSTGHLILTSHVLNVPQSDFVKSFEISIQAGAILSVVVMYWRTLFLDHQAVKRILVSFVPTALIGIIMYQTFKQFLLGNELIVVSSLLIGGAFIIIFELIFGKKELTVDEISKISYKKCILIGIFQSVSIIPGVSRAGATIIGGMAIGINRETIVKFSFLLAIPTMLSATGFDLVQSSPEFSLDQMGSLAAGFITSFVVALLAIKYFLKFVKNNNLLPFGIYRVIIGLAFLLFI
jgi:undecaprenyl-diphosphatase